jgi:hypothetical protein
MPQFRGPTHKGPLVTLAAVVAVGLAVVLVDVSTRDAADTPVAAATRATPARAEPATGETTAEPTTVAPVVTGGAYAGRTAGREMTVAIAVDGTHALGYACDGRHVEAWLDGTLDGDQLDLTAKDGTTVTGTVTADDVSGTLVNGGRSLPFTADSAAPPSGLYEGRADVRGVRARIGWIVLPDGSQVGAGKVGDAPVDAPPLDLDGPTSLDGAAVTVTPISGGAR